MKTLQPNTIKKDFKTLLKSAEGLENSASCGNDTYYQFQEDFRKELRVFLKKDFSTLSTKQLLQLCAWISTHRPVAPFSFLITCSLLNDKLN